MTRRALQLFVTSGMAFLAPAAFAQTPAPDPQPTPEPMPPTEPVPIEGDIEGDIDVDTDPDIDVDATYDTPDPVTTDIDPTVTGDPSYVTNRTYQNTTTEVREPFLRRAGVSLTAGGGVSGFTNDTARGATQDGGNWDVRATIGTRSPIAAEVSYIGSAQTIDALGLDNDALLLGNGMQTNLRLNLTMTTAVQPFLFGGVAWRHYDLANVDTNTSDISDNDNVFEFPVGVGLAYRYRGVLLDARGEFRPTVSEDMMPTVGDQGLLEDEEAALHRWGVNANVGFEF